MSGSGDYRSGKSLLFPASNTKLPKKEPPPETIKTIQLRRLIIVSFWVITAAIGVPIWWATTAIYRAKLPTEEMMDWANGRVC